MAPRALVTNDDGIDSPGLVELARCARDAGFDVVVAAPAGEASGTSASVVAAMHGGQVAAQPRELPGLPGVPAYAVSAQPAFIVHAAVGGWLDPAPELVLSGINLGSNVGRAILHSGTVGAALTAYLHDARGFAVSLDTGLVAPPDPHWASAAQVAAGLLDRVLAAPAGTVVSLNVPNRPAAGLGPLRRAALARFGQVRARIEPTETGTLTLSAGPSDEVPEPGTDVALLAAGHPTITEIGSVADRGGTVIDLWLNGR